MAPLEVEAEVSKSALKLIYKPQKNPINPNLKLMKSLGVEGRSAGACASIHARVRALRFGCFGVAVEGDRNPYRNV